MDPSSRGSATTWLNGLRIGATDAVKRGVYPKPHGSLQLNRCSADEVGGRPRTDTAD